MKSSFSEIINSDKPVLIDFHATWCGPCKAMNPILEQIARETGDNIRIIKIDIDNNRPLAQKLKVMGVPTFMIYKEGTLQWRGSGMQSKQQLLAQIEAAQS